MKHSPRLPLALVFLLCVTAGAGCVYSSPRGEDAGFKPASPQITPKPYADSPGSASLPSERAAGNSVLPSESDAMPFLFGIKQIRGALPEALPKLSAQDHWTQEEVQDAMYIHSAKIYFYFDNAELTDGARDVLRQKAIKIRGNPNFYITIVGYADERGTEAYNLLLGERRAQAAFNFLVSQGVPPAQLGTFSYGKKQPASGTDWSLERRDEFFVTRLP